ncbi:hypothetical protein LTS18_013252 [Coniosporium uncinatum]|uniref:Uncharacterized protein n=1 Tax=Coniosporium uncinatum TaxID=93489 RepID=A0ACC3DVQ6_9PEZI|nr:hypothetical protein LTS18_013252 [Coniosporium uncinatum]
MSSTAQSTPVVSPPGQDEHRPAFPFESKVLTRLTPTLRKFILLGKVAIVTGVTSSGGRGLGFNIAQSLCESGIRGLAIFDMQQQLGETAAREMSKETGVDVRFYKVDVRDEHEIAAAVADMAERFGRIDVLVNAAGIAE